MTYLKQSDKPELHHNLNESHYVIFDSVTFIRRVSIVIWNQQNMKILDEIKKQVEQEMLKIKKVSPQVVQPPMNSNTRTQLIQLLDKGIALKDAAKQINVTYHQAKIAYNEYKRKAQSYSENSSSTEVPAGRTAGVTKLKSLPHHFVIQSSVGNSVTSVKKLYNVIVIQSV